MRSDGQWWAIYCGGFRPWWTQATFRKYMEPPLICGQAYYPMGNTILGQHNGMVTCAFIDGHVSSLPMTQIWLAAPDSGLSVYTSMNRYYFDANSAVAGRGQAVP